MTDMGSDTPRGGHVFDLAVGETIAPAIGGQERRITLLGLDEPRCCVRGVIRFPSARVDIDGVLADVPGGLYHMPQIDGELKVGCSVTRGVADAVGRRAEVYALDKDARVRCWLPDDPLIGPDPLTYPARQVWFASMTQMANERTYVDGGEVPPLKPNAYVYHHYGMDIGGHDKAVPVVAAQGGRVVCRGEDTVPGYDPSAGQPRYDRVMVTDAEGWHYRYSHLDMIAPGIVLGREVSAGDPIGVLGKEGASGGWSHLHFSIITPQPSGRYGEAEGYPFLVEAYLYEHPRALLACARPHRVAAVGEAVTLDGSRSVSGGADIVGWQWSLHDGTMVDGVRTEVRYEREGMYSEMLTVTDSRGHSEVDFCVVQVIPADGSPGRTPPAMHLTYYPTEGLRSGQPVAFKVRSFFKGEFAQNRAGEDHWDFGDGATATSRSSEPARTRSAENLDFDERWHAYDRPGRYIVTVTRTGANGLSATAQVKVDVQE